MRTIASPTKTIVISDYDLDTISKASRRLARDCDDLRMSQHEINAAAIVNGRIEFLPEEFRKVQIRMGRAWAHAIVELMFDHWEREMDLSPDHPDCPFGDQRIFTAYEE